MEKTQIEEVLIKEGQDYPRCGGCKHWIKWDVKSNEGFFVGICLRSSQDTRMPKSVVGLTTLGNDPYARVLTGEGFGCVLHEARLFGVNNG